MQTKTCKKCGTTKPLTDFYENRNMKDGRLNSCKVCCIEYRKNIYTKEENVARSRMYATGCSPERYAELMEKQGGVCAICGGVNANGRTLAADHNHRTKKVRGLLCSKCNHGIGLFDESVKKMKAAIRYLILHR